MNQNNPTGNQFRDIKSKAKIEEILETLKGKRVGVFCDGANLFYASKENRWQIDLGKFKKLIAGYCDLQFINYYLAVPAKNDSAFYDTQKFLERIKSFVNIKNKELKYISIGGRIMKKGNMDIEIVLDVVRAIGNLDVVIIVSGDSDFLELGKYVVRENKKHIIYASYEKNMSWELRKCWHIYLEKIKNEIRLQ